MKGCDISYANGTVNFDQLKKAVDFVIIRAGYTGAPDTQFKRNQAEARRVGLKRGYYWFTYPSSATQDADQFVNTVGALQPGEFLVLDYEVPQGGVAYCKTFLDRVKARTGTTPFLYTNENRTVTLDWSSVKKTYPLWVAIYDNNPTAPVNTNGWKYIIKQYTADGRLPGIAGAVDLDYATSDPSGKDEMLTPGFINTIIVYLTAAAGKKRNATAAEISKYSGSPPGNFESYIASIGPKYVAANAATIKSLQDQLAADNAKLDAQSGLSQTTKDQIAQTNENVSWIKTLLSKIFK